MLMNYAIVIAGLVVNTVVWDGNLETWQPPEDSIAVLMPEDIPVSTGWHFDGTDFTAPVEAPPPPLTPAEILAINTSTRNALLTQAASAIAPLQDAYDLGIIEPGEQQLLTAWKTFRVGVSRVDLMQVSPVWPSPPAPLNYAQSAPAS